MHLTRYLDDVVAWAPAKVNLYLEVLAKRPDGYHAIETLMVTAGLFDTLVLAPAPAEVTLTCSDPTLSTGEENLVVRAAAPAATARRLRPGLHDAARKAHPDGGGACGRLHGRGGHPRWGSNRLWQLGLSVTNWACSARSWAAMCHSSSTRRPPGARAAARSSRPRAVGGRSSWCCSARRSDWRRPRFIARSRCPATGQRHGDSHGAGPRRRGGSGPAPVQPAARRGSPP